MRAKDIVACAVMSQRCWQVSNMKIIVVGGSGMIGQAIQAEVIKQGIKDRFVFTYNTNRYGILPYVESIHVDLLNPQSVKQVENFSSAIYLAGNTDHALASTNPQRDLQLNVETFLNLMKFFKGSLVLFSSQAVYHGHIGSVKEQTQLNPTIPYGISKHTMEMYAAYFKRIGKLTSLIILRPTYIYGKGEKERRLIPQCARAATTNGVIKIFGHGQSFLNPLPVEFVGQVVLKFINVMRDRKYEMLVNLNHPEAMMVLDVVRVLQDVKPFKYVLEEGGEAWPTKHYGDTTLLLSLLREWGMEMPDAKTALKKYFADLVGGGHSA